MQQVLWSLSVNLLILVPGSLIHFLKDNRPNGASSVHVKEKNIIDYFILLNILFCHYCFNQLPFMLGLFVHFKYNPFLTKIFCPALKRRQMRIFTLVL